MTAGSTALSPQRRKFALEYLKTGNITEAAVKAGYSPKTAKNQGSRLLTFVDVQQFLAGRVAKAEIEHDRIVLELGRLALEEIPNIVDFFDPDGNMRPLHSLTLEQQRTLASVEFVRKNLAAGDGKTDLVVKFKQWDLRGSKIKALELLARVMGWVKPEPPPQVAVPIFAIACLPQLSPDPPRVVDVTPR